MTATNLALASIKSTGSSATRTFGDRLADMINAKDYGAKGDGVFATATVSITSGAGALTATGVTFTSADIGKMIAVPGAGAAGATLNTTIATFTDATHVGLTANAGTTLSAVSKGIAYGTDDATALGSAITAAVAANKPLYLPAGYFTYTPPLTISGNLTIVGSGITATWVNKNAVPSGLQGSVLCPASNGSHAVQSTTTAVQINVSNIGVQFQTLYVGTGDGFNITPTSTNQGLTGSVWFNVLIFGHDGDHYAFNVTNPIYCSVYSMNTWGGGSLNIAGSTGTYHFGNIYFAFHECYVVVAGASHGINISAAAAQTINLVTFLRPITVVADNSISGISPPTSAQYIFKQDANCKFISVLTPDFETTVSSPIQLGVSASSNYFDWQGASNSGGPINAPAWTTNGLRWGAITKTLTDTTSSGTVAVAGTNVFPGDTIAASSTSTYTAYATAYFGSPAAGTNVTISTPYSIYCTSNILTASGITAQSGVTSIKGTIQLNLSNGASTTAIGNGSTTGAVQIGGASNTVGLGLSAVSTAVVSILAATTAKSSLNIGAGTAPTSPVNGDIWFDGTNIKMQIGGATKTFTLT